MGCVFPTALSTAVVSSGHLSAGCLFPEHFITLHREAAHVTVLCGWYLVMLFLCFITSFGQLHVHIVCQHPVTAIRTLSFKMLSAPPCHCSQLPRRGVRSCEVSCCFQSQGKQESVCNKEKTASVSKIAASRGLKL